MNFDVVSNDDFEFSFGGNIAFNRTKLESLGVPADDFYINGIAEQRSFFLVIILVGGKSFNLLQMYLLKEKKLAYFMVLKQMVFIKQMIRI